MKKKIDIKIFFVFFLAVVLRSLLYFRAVEMEFRIDDFSPLVYAARFGGYNWTRFVSGLSKYYGYGYYWLMAPVFRFCNSVNSIVLTISLIQTILIGATSALIYYISTRYMGLENGWFAVFTALATGIFVGDSQTLSQQSMVYRTDNEIPVFFAIWIFTLFAMKALSLINAERKKRVIVSIEAALALVWGLTLHERSIAVILCAVCVEILVVLLKKKWIFHPQSFFLTLIVGYLTHKKLRRMVMYAFWRKTSLGNSSAFNKMSLWFLESKVNLKAFLVLLFGNLHTFIVNGYGIPCIAIVIAFGWVFRSLYLRIRENKLKPVQTEGESSIISPAEMLILIFGVTVTIIIIGHSMRWGLKLANGFRKNEIVYQYKGICYSRYYYCYTGPIVLGTLVYLRNKVKTVKTELLAVLSVLIYVASEAVYLLFVNKYSTVTPYYAMRAAVVKLFLSGEPMVHIIIGIVLALIVLLLCVLAMFANKKGKTGTAHKLLILVPVFIVILIANNRIIRMEPSQTSLHFRRQEPIREIFKAIDEANETCSTKDVDIFLAGKNTRYTVQVEEKERSFFNRKPGEKDTQDLIFIGGGKNQNLLDRGFLEFKYDMLWVYTNVEEYKDIFQKYSY